MKRIILGFRGAGILVATKDHEGKVRVLLGKRTKHPFKDWWSIPGGQLDDDKPKSRHGLFWQVRTYTEDFPQGAVRELREELHLWSGAQALPKAECVGDPYSVRTPFSRWATYLWFVENPTLKLPMAKAPVEFSEFVWAVPGTVPHPLHPGVRGAVRFHLGQDLASR